MELQYEIRYACIVVGINLLQKKMVNDCCSVPMPLHLLVIFLLLAVT